MFDREKKIAFVRKELLNEAEHDSNYSFYSDIVRYPFSDFLTLKNTALFNEERTNDNKKDSRDSLISKAKWYVFYTILYGLFTIISRLIVMLPNSNDALLSLLSGFNAIFFVLIGMSFTAYAIWIAALNSKTLNSYLLINSFSLEKKEIKRISSLYVAVNKSFLGYLIFIISITVSFIISKFLLKYVLLPSILGMDIYATLVQISPFFISFIFLMTLHVFKETVSLFRTIYYCYINYALSELKK